MIFGLGFSGNEWEKVIVSILGNLKLFIVFCVGSVFFRFVL